MAVAFSLEELEPAVALEFFSQDESFADFAVFDLHQLIIDVASGVAFTEDLEGLFVPAHGDEETGRFRDQPDGNQLND
jgi:hypothetical protein